MRFTSRSGTSLASVSVLRVFLNGGSSTRLESLGTMRRTATTISGSVAPGKGSGAETLRARGLEFKRRCVFHHIEFPRGGQLETIVKTRLGDGVLNGSLADAVKHFESIRELKLLKKPATAELLAWITVLQQWGIDAGTLKLEKPFSEQISERQKEILR